MRNLRILLLTSKKILCPDMKVVGDTSTSPWGDTEVEDYIELLSANNFPFDLKYNDELMLADIISEGNIQYSTIILALPEASMTDENVDLIKRASYEFGVSVIASYDRVGNRTQELFGIDQMKGRRFRFPCTILISKNQVVDVNIEPEIKLGDGWNISWQRWGLRRNPLRYFKKHFKKFREQVFLTMQIEVSANVQIVAVIKGNSAPAITKYRFGNGTNYYIALHSDTFLDRFNSLHRIVREFIRENSGWGMAEFNLENTMVLRMDDPGTCERVYLAGYDTRIMSEEDWLRVANLLKKHEARLSIMYVPLWLDDGNVDNGTLFVNGKQIRQRKRGETYPSKDVVFLKRNGNSDEITYDYVTEFNSLREGLLSGWVDIESHGLTHVDTDLDSWLDAEDRYSNPEWYHEFRHVKDDRDVTEVEQSMILRESAARIESVFGILPTAVTPSGHEQSNNSEKIAHKAGYKLFSGEYNSIQKKGFVIRNDKLKSIFFESTGPDFSFSRSGYPIVGVFHDYDIVLRGVDWLNGVIEGWKEKGIDKFITLRELAGYLCSSIEAYYEDSHKLNIKVDISDTGDVLDSPGGRYFSNQPMPLYIQLPQGKSLRNIKVNDQLWQNFKFNRQLHRIELVLPPFRHKEEQEILITLEG